MRGAGGRPAPSRRVTPAFLFPGQLSEFVGMGRDFFEREPGARDLFDLTSRRCGRDMRALLFSGPKEALSENLAAQAGVYLVSTLAARALARRGIEPPATAGYSLGNYAAMVAPGQINSVLVTSISAIACLPSYSVTEISPSLRHRRRRSHSLQIAASGGGTFTFGQPHQAFEPIALIGKRGEGPLKRLADCGHAAVRPVVEPKDRLS